MKYQKLKIEDLLLIEPDVYGDNRGWFSETYSYDRYKDIGIKEVFIQDNQSYSAYKNVFRGIHYQKEPYAQTKLVRCIRGKILDIAVDLRKGSPTNLHHVAIELSAENKRQHYIPKGFGHAFITLTDDCEVFYKVDAKYNKDADRSIQANDPQINLNIDVKNLIRSEKDINAPFLADSDCDFTYKY